MADLDFNQLRSGSELLKKVLLECNKVVSSDVVNPEQAV